MSQASNNIRRMIVGLGVTGLATTRYCLKQGWRFDLCDSRVNPPGLDEAREAFPDARIFTSELPVEELKSCDQLIVSPGIALATPAIAAAVEAGAEAVGDIELFARHINALPETERPLIAAITGSNGKSTVTTLLAEALNAGGVHAEMAGNIGVPVLDLLSREQLPKVFVMELSSFQLETTSSLKPDVSVLLNLSEDHMDRYDDMAGYLAAKQRIFSGATKAVVNLDDDASVVPVAMMSPELENQLIGFALQLPKSNGQFGLRVLESGRFELGEQRDGEFVALFNSDELKLKGLHNFANILAVLSLLKALESGLDDFDSEAALNKIKDFEGLPHRCQWVGNHNGVNFINDSKGTNVGSTMAALFGLGPQVSGKLWLLLGGDAKGQDVHPLIDPCRQFVAGVVAYGKDGAAMADVLSGALGNQVQTHVLSTMSEAFDWAVRSASEGDLVLLSPAAASLDQFPNYMVRGQAFAELVEALS